MPIVSSLFTRWSGKGYLRTGWLSIRSGRGSAVGPQTAVHAIPCWSRNPNRIVGWHFQRFSMGDIRRASIKVGTLCLLPIMYLILRDGFFPAGR